MTLNTDKARVFLNGRKCSCNCHTFQNSALLLFAIKFNIVITIKVLSSSPPNCSRRQNFACLCWAGASVPSRPSERLLLTCARVYNYIIYFDTTRQGVLLSWLYIRIVFLKLNLPQILRSKWMQKLRTKSWLVFARLARVCLPVVHFTSILLSTLHA